MSNPFDNETVFVVLINDEGQHSLWPNSIKVPEGWKTIYGPAEKENCLEFVNRNWTDLRPASLVNASLK